MAAGSIRRVELTAADPGTLRAFYEEVFDFRPRDVEPLPGHVAFTDADGRVRGGIGRRNAAGDRGVLFYVTVTCLEDAVRAVEAAGGSVIAARTDLGDGSGAYAVVRDPAGNTIGLWEEA